MKYSSTWSKIISDRSRFQTRISDSKMHTLEGPFMLLHMAAIERKQVNRNHCTWLEFSYFYVLKPIVGQGIERATFLPWSRHQCFSAAQVLLEVICIRLLVHSHLRMNKPPGPWRALKPWLVHHSSLPSSIYHQFLMNIKFGYFFPSSKS